MHSFLNKKSYCTDDNNGTKKKLGISFLVNKGSLNIHVRNEKNRILWAKKKKFGNLLFLVLGSLDFSCKEMRRTEFLSEKEEMYGCLTGFD